jgi:hypothetical protein
LGESNVFLILGSNVRLESPILNSKLRRLYLDKKKKCFFFSVGLALNYLTFPVINIKNSSNFLVDLAESKTFFMRKLFIKDFLNSYILNFCDTCFSKSSILLGNSFMNRFDSTGLFKSLFYFFKSFSLFSSFLNFFPLSSHLGRITAADLGFSPGLNACFSKGNSAFLKTFMYFYKIDYFPVLKKSTFLVSQGSFTNNAAFTNKATLLLPSQIFAEQKQFFINLEGRIRTTKKAISSFNMVPSDYKVIFSLFLAGKFFLSSNFSILSNFYKLLSFFGSIIKYDSKFLFSFKTLYKNLFHEFTFFLSRRYSVQNFHIFLFNFTSTRIFNSIFPRSINNFYESDLFCENSKTLTLCSLKTINYNFSNFILKDSI